MAYSLDEFLGAFIGALAAGEAGNWRAGDIVVRALGDLSQQGFVPREYARQRAKLLAMFAMNAPKPCTAARVRQLAAVSGTFGTEQRYPDLTWSYFRAAVQAAHRTQVPARALLDEAVQAEWTIGYLNGLGKKNPEAVRLQATCGVCGMRALLRLAGAGVEQAFRGAALPCPNCIARAWADSTDGKDAERLGVWE